MMPTSSRIPPQRKLRRATDVAVLLSPYVRWMDDKENSESTGRAAKGAGVGVGIALGMSVGVSIGIATDSLATWLAIGLALGIAFGAAFDSRGRGAD